MSMVLRVSGLAVLAVLMAVGAAAETSDPLQTVRSLLEDTAEEPTGPIEESVDAIFGVEEGSEEAPPGDPGAGPSLGDRLREAFADEMFIVGAAAVLTTVAGLAGFALVTRYISPKEALKNPQRAMLYGFVKATPGAHLKQLSEEFNMKTSSILWHIRKLESADLVRSERANGFRVFYPVQGGVEVKRLSRAITALQNANALRIHETIDGKPGLSVKELSERLDTHSGTVRWHVRKLREFGLIEELVREEGSAFYGTPMGRRALETVVGRPSEKRPARRGVPVPEGA